MEESASRIIRVSDRLAFELPAYTSTDLTFVILGGVLLLFGWIIFRAGTRVFSLALGTGFGFFVGEVLNIILKVDRDYGLMITIGTSALGALLAFFMVRAVTNFLFALIGFLFGALLGRLIAEVHADMNQMEFVFTKEAGGAILVLGVVTGVLAIWLQRLIMILITSYMGATFVVAGVPLLSQYPMAFPAVLVIGILWQAMIMGRIFSTRKRVAPSRRLED